MHVKTRILLDNTTFAAAGRAIYCGDFTTEGGVHAEQYYRRYSDAQAIDERSLAELITAIILFDQLLWEGSSWYTQESERMQEQHAQDYDPKTAWLYTWFPLFSLAHDENIIQHHFTKNPSMLLMSARKRALEWVAKRMQSGMYKLPEGFKIPQSYYDPEHHERESLEWIIRSHEFNFNKTYIPLALFLARGLYYQSAVMREEGWSYLPHSFRSLLLDDAEQQAAALLCSATTTFDAEDVLKDLDDVFLRRVAETVKLPVERYRGIAIGAAFLRAGRSARQAIEEAIMFRTTSRGAEVREQFGELVELGLAGALPPIQVRLKEIDKSLRDSILHRYGYVADDAREISYALGFMGPVKNAMEAVLGLLPASKRAAVTKFLYTPLTRPTGFQLLFSYYFPEGRISR